MTDTPRSSPETEGDTADLTIAPGADDLTFGSLLYEMIRHCFNRVESLAPEREHRFYTECKLCGGTDNDRSHYRPSIELVLHDDDCELGRHMPRLKAMANKGAT